MSCDWRIRRIIPIALKCYIHVLYAVASPAEGTGGPALLIFRPPPLSEGLDPATVMGYVTLLLSC